MAYEHRSTHNPKQHMKITKITYQKAFITGPFLQERIGFEAEVIEEIQSVPDALAQLKGMAEDFHKQSNPHLYQESKTAEGVIAEFTRQSLGIPVISKESERLEIQIDNAQTLEDLSTIKEACGKAGLVSEYMKKLNELMTGRPKDFTENLD